MSGPQKSADARQAKRPTSAEELAALAHHGDIDTFSGAVDFAVNVRSVAPPGWLRERLNAALDQLGSYPSRAETEAVRQRIAERHQVPAAAVMLLAGASEGFALLAAHIADIELRRAFQENAMLRPAIILHPAYTEPEAALRRLGMPIQRILLPAPYVLPSPLPDISHGAVVVCGNPTNPTSVLHPASDVAALGGPGRILVVDEAFMDLAAPLATPSSGSQAEMAEPESLAGSIHTGRVVLRSLTKTWALAGLRAGYAVGDPELIAQLERRRPPWSIGTVQLAAFRAVFSAQGERELQAERERVRTQRTAMCQALQRSGIEIACPPAAPFILVRLPQSADPKVFRQELRRAGIAVRRCDTFPGLDWHGVEQDKDAMPSKAMRTPTQPTLRHEDEPTNERCSAHLRLAVRPQEQVDKLIAAWPIAAAKSSTPQHP